MCACEREDKVCKACRGRHVARWLDRTKVGHILATIKEKQWPWTSHVMRSTDNKQVDDQITLQSDNPGTVGEVRGDR